MDQKLLKTLQTKLKALLASKNKNELSQEEFLDSVITYVVDDVKGVERYTYLVDIFHAKAPLFIACKNNGFWQPTEKPDGHEQPIVGIQSQRKRSSRNSSDRDHSNVFGSPLKLDIIADLSISEDDPMVPVSVNKHNMDFGMELPEVRELVSLYSLLVTSGLSISDMHPPTLLAISDCKNLRGVSVMGIEPLTDSRNNFKGVKVTDIVSKPQTDRSSIIKLNPNFASSVVKCKAKYEILTKSRLKFNLDLQNSIQLELEWTEKSSQNMTLLSQPPLKASSVAMINWVSGSTESPLLPFYQVNSAFAGRFEM